MLRTVFLSLGCALVLAAPGCTYARHLRKDAAETLHVGIGASLVPGLYVRAEAPVFGSSVGWLPRATYVGTDYGYTFIWRQAGAGIVLGGQMVRTHTNVEIERYWNGYLGNAYLDQSHYLVINVVATDKRTKLGSEETIPFSKVELGAHVLFVGVQVGVDVIQVLDLVAGVFGWDMLGDDEWVAAPQPTPEELEESEGFRVIEALKAMEEAEDAADPEGGDAADDFPADQPEVESPDSDAPGSA